MVISIIKIPQLKQDPAEGSRYIAMPTHLAVPAPNVELVVDDHTPGPVSPRHHVCISLPGEG